MEVVTSCVEKVSVAKLDYLLSLDQIYDNPEKNLQTVTLLQKYKKYSIKGCLATEYKPSKKRKGYGRIYPYVGNGKECVGLSMMCSGVRGYLASDNYIDVDMKKCHMYILRHLFSKHRFGVHVIDNLISDLPDITKWCKKNKTTLKHCVYGVVNSTASILTGNQKKLFDEFESVSEMHETLHTALIKPLKEDYKQLWDLCEKTKEENVDGMFIGNVLQHLECQIVTKAVKSLRKADISVGSVIHDGFLILIDKKNENFNDYVLEVFGEICENLNLRYPNLNPQFVIKPFPENKFPSGDELANEAKNSEEVETLHMCFDRHDPFTFSDFREMARTTTFDSRDDMVATCLPQIPKVVYLIESIGWAFKETTTEISFLKEVSKFYLYWKSDGGIKSELFSKFITSPEIHRIFKRIRGVCFQPNLNVPVTDKFNIFNGFAGFSGNNEPLNKNEMEKVQPFINHALEVLASGNSKYAHYITSFFAQIVQRPDVKSRVGLVLYSSKKQIGKNIFTDFLRDFVFGNDYALSRDNLSQITDDKNGDLEKAIMCVVDEASAKNGKYHNDFDKLKSMITSDKRRLRKLYVDAYEVDDFTRYVFTTNNIHSVKIEKDDARYACFEVSGHRQHDREYFNRLVNCRTEEHGKLFYRYLLNYNVDIDLRDIPYTDLKRRMEGLSKSNVCSFAEEIKEQVEQLDECDVKDYEYDHDQERWLNTFKEKVEITRKGIVKIKQKDIYDVYKTWCEEQGDVAVKLKYFKVDMEDEFKYTKILGQRVVQLGKK